MKFPFSVAALFGSATLLLAQTPQSSQQTQTPASVEGQVLKAESGMPLADVIVELVSTRVDVAPGTLQSSAGNASITSRTTADGRFVFQSVPAGEYRLYATHSNVYGPAEYGQHSPSGLGVPITLAAGQTKSGIKLTLTPTASISGRVTDANREPAAFTSMLAFRIVYRQGVRTVEVVQSVLTDDRGEYRLFWLVPGKYYLSALPIQARPYSLPLSFPSRVGGAVYLGTPVIALRASDTGEVFDETYLPIYYPGTLDIRAAKPIVLRPGENLRADFDVGPSVTRTLEVSGVVVDASGKPLSSARLSLSPRKAEGHSVVLPAATSDPSGNFHIRGVVPGSYLLYVTGNSAPPTARGTPSLPAGVTLSSVLQGATIPLAVGTSDVTNLKIQTEPGADIPWSFSFEPRSGADPTPPSVRVSLIREPNLAGAPPPSGNNALPDLALAQSRAPQVLMAIGSGDYRVNVGPLPRGGYVKSIRLGTADVLKDGLHVTGAVREELQIVVSANAGDIEGVVTDLNRQPFLNATIALLPEITQRAGRPELFRNTNSNEEGKFRFEGVAPGEYKIFAWEDIPQGDWYDPDVMLKHEALGMTILVDEIKTKTAEIRVIPADRSEP